MSALQLSADLQSADLAFLADALDAMEAAGFTEIHCDVSDGAFAPGFGVGTALVEAVRARTKLPLHGHLQTFHPERHVDAFVAAGCNTVTIHAERCDHAHRVLNQIREAGAAPGIALYPSTPLTHLEYLLPEVDRVLLLCTEPGCTAEALRKISYERARILKENLRFKKSAVQVEAEGNIGIEDGARLRRAGADRIVLDGATVFADDAGGLAAATAAYVQAVDDHMHLV